MSYSMDPEENKRNSETPSIVSMEHQLVYKFASLEATLSNSLRRLDEKMDRLQTDLHDRHIETSGAINHLTASVEARFNLKRQRLDQIEKDLRRVEDNAAKVAHDKAYEVKTETKKEIDHLCERMEKQEKWQTILVTRISAGGAVIATIWVVFGDYIRVLLGTNV